MIARRRLSALPVSTAGSGISSRRLLLTHPSSSRAALKDSGRGAGSTCHCRSCRNALLTSAITCESRYCRASSLLSCTSARESRHSCLSSGSVLPTRAVAPHIMISGRRHHQRVMSVSNICRVATAAPSPAITSGGKSTTFSPCECTQQPSGCGALIGRLGVIISSGWHVRSRRGG